MLTILPVEGKKQLKKFIDFPHDLYAGNPNYVPELFMGQKDLLSPSKHPFISILQHNCFLRTGTVKL